YVDAERSLVPNILEGAVGRGFNVVYLPRGRGDEQFAEPYPSDRVFVPEQALNGLQLAWHTQCVLTGSGTMAREAACMDKPAVSFFPNSLLSVDEELVSDEKILHSRNSTSILDYIGSLSSNDISPDRSRSKTVLQEVGDITTNLIKNEINRE
ncbi:DUF354 domain-containing protein, partial [Haladaptatus sp. W1]